MSEISVRQLLYSLDFNDEEIDELISFCPKLELIDPKRISMNITLLVEHGYPECDLRELFLVNPAILVHNNQELLQKLIELGDNIETKIKNNPNII